MIGFVLAVVAGIALALPFLRYARGRRGVFAAGLVVAACVYVVFALAADDLRGALIEAGGVILFAAFLLFRRSPYLLALGWVMHVGWDLLLHPVGVASYAPWWYPVTCIGFDLVVAVGIVSSGRRAAPPPPAPPP